MDEAKKSYKKKRKHVKTMLAAFYGRGDGRSAATVPPFRAPGSNTSPKLGPALPGPSGMNSPQFGTVAAGGGVASAPMASSKEYTLTGDQQFIEAMNLWKEQQLDENFHHCFVCSNTGKRKDGKPCEICSTKWNSQRVKSPYDTIVDGGNADNSASFIGFDKGWDLS